MRRGLYLVIEESKTFDLEDVELVGVVRTGGVQLGWLDRGRQDGPLELQDSITNIHLTQVPEVMCSLVPAWPGKHKEEAIVTELLNTALIKLTAARTNPE